MKHVTLGLRPVLALSVLVAVASSGCVEYYSARTILHSDGTVERWVYQPASSLPPSEAWLFHRLAAKPGDGVSVRVPDNPQDLPLPPNEESAGAAYVLAQGRFPSIEAIPEHVAFTSSDGTLRARFVRSYGRNDFGWFVEHVWQETLPDVVTLQGMREARQHLANLIMDYLMGTIRAAYGPMLDTGALEEYCRRDAMQFWEELTDRLYETSLQPGGHRRLEDTLRQVLKRYGVELPARNQNGQLDGGPLREFVRGKLLVLLKQTDGSAVPQEIVNEIVDWLLPTETQQSPESSGTRLEQAAEAYRRERFGGDEQFNQHVQRLSTRILGIHYVNAPSRRFHYEMEVPGIVVETTGKLIADNRVLWEFEAVEAYPSGYRMYVRCWEPRTDIQEKLWGEVRFAERSELCWLGLWASEDSQWAAALIASAKEGSLEPIKQYLEAQPNAWRSVDWKRRLIERIEK